MRYWNENPEECARLSREDPDALHDWTGAGNAAPKNRPDAKPLEEELKNAYRELAADRENLMKLERDWHKVINEVLKCNPIPARDRPDGQLEPPWEVIARLREQLAAEREKAQKLIEYGVKLDDWNDKLQEQLAAEREVGHNTAVALAQQITKLEDQVATERETFWPQLHKELAAEREKVQTLVDALKQINELDKDEETATIFQIAKAALPMINDDPVIELKP